MSRGAIRRHALSLWLAVIAVLGLLRFFGKAFRDGSFQPDAIAWTWLAGAVAVALAAVLLALRGRRR